MKKIEKVYKGLAILSAYSNNLRIDIRNIVAGPEDDIIDEELVKELEDMGWVFDEGEGWSILI